MFLERKNKKAEQQLAAGVPNCTFKPNIENTKHERANMDIVDRLYAYLEYYEKRKSEYKKRIESSES